MNIDLFLEEYKHVLRSLNTKSLLSVSFDITRKCNLKCKHCYYKNRNVGVDYLSSIERAFEVAQKLSELNVMEIVICGGEPLCSDYIVDFLRFLKERDVMIRLLTNGILIDQYIGELSCLFDNNDVLQVSIDEPLKIKVGQRYSNASQDDSRVRVFANLEKACSNLRNVIVNITPTVFNQNYIPNIVEDVAARGVRNISTTPYMPIGGINADVIKPDYHRLKMVNQEVGALCKKYNIIFYGELDGHPCQNPSTPAGKRSWVMEDVPYRTCDAAYFSLHLSNDGIFFPCVFFQGEGLEISSIKYSVHKISNDFYKTNPIHMNNLPDKCKRCKFYSNCNGGCMGLIFNRYGTVGDYVDPRCIH